VTIPFGRTQKCRARRVDRFARTFCSVVATLAAGFGTGEEQDEDSFRRWDRHVRDTLTLEPVEEPRPENELPIGPSRPEDRVPLGVGRFRTERQYVLEHVFLDVPGGSAPCRERRRDVQMDGLDRTADDDRRAVVQGQAWAD
jgi:hypothetical protein